MERHALFISNCNLLLSNIHAQLSSRDIELVHALHETDGIQRLTKRQYCLIVSDLTYFQDSNHVESLKNIRNSTAAPILVLASWEHWESIIEILSADIDICLPANTPVQIIAAYCNRLLASFLARQPEDALEHGESTHEYDLIIDNGKHIVIADGKKVHLRRREFMLLNFFAVHANMVLTFNQISNYIWGSDYDYIKNIAVLISELRRCLGDNPKQPKFIKNIWGTGYMLAIPKRRILMANKNNLNY